MKRFGIHASGAFLALIIGGCDSGIPEGPPKEGPMDAQPADFKAYMKKNADNMARMKKPGAKPAGAPASTPAPTAEAKETP